LAIPVKAKSEDDDVEAEPNRALAALEDAAKAMGRRISDAANVAGTGVATAAGAVTRPFRSVDLDGDGIPDAPQALTAVKGRRWSDRRCSRLGRRRGRFAVQDQEAGTPRRWCRATPDRGHIGRRRGVDGVGAAPSGV